MAEINWNLIRILCVNKFIMKGYQMSPLNFDGIKDDITPPTPPTVSKIPVASTNTLTEVVSKDTTTDHTKDGPVISLTGPLSSVYAKALDLAYKHEQVGMSNETMELDEISNANVVLNYPDNAFKDSIIKADRYAYVVSSDQLDCGGVDEAFSAITILSDRTNNNVLVAIEGMPNVLSNKRVILEDYLNKANIPVYRKREMMIDRLING